MAQAVSEFEGEEILYMFRKHPVVMRRGLILAMLALLAGTIPSLIKPEMSYFWGGLGAGLVLSMALMLPSWVHWYFSYFIITEKRFIQSTQKGFFHKKVIDIALNQIQMVNYEIAGIQETLLGFGTMNIQTLVGDLVIHDVHKPHHVQHELLSILRARGFATTTTAVESSDE
jgi:Bacterial PH domain